MASSQGKTSDRPALYAQPIVELLHSAAILGEDFERRISPALPEETAANANGILFMVSFALKTLKRATKGKRTPQVKEAIAFLEDLRNDFTEISRNASDAFDRRKEVRRG